MNEFSELHHTFLIGNFYKLLVDRFGARGRHLLWERSVTENKEAIVWRRELYVMAGL